MPFLGTSQERLILSRSLTLSLFKMFRTIPVVQSVALGHVDITGCAGVDKVELDGIVTVIGYREESSWKRMSALGAGEMSIKGDATVRA